MMIIDRIINIHGTINIPVIIRYDYTEMINDWLYLNGPKMIIRGADILVGAE